MGYITSGMIVPIFFIAVIVYGTLSNDVYLLSLLVRLLTFGWHYAKQGFGVFTLLTRLKNFNMTSIERNLLLINTHLSWIYAWVLFNTQKNASLYLGLPFQTFEIPKTVEQFFFFLFILSSLLCLCLFFA